jgi:coproporphyrinogen III oxidase-like Fe-S oxidoreductase
LRDDAWLNRRAALHDRYLEVARVGDASRLAFLRGPETTWTEEGVAELWREGTRKAFGTLEPLNCVYVHVPFCKSICTFCNYDRLQPSSPALLKNWLARVLRSIQVIGPAVRQVTFHALYIGGGTPSVLPAHMLRELLDALDTTLSWDRKARRKMEFDPAVMNRDRLKVLKAHRIKELSFGIETLDPEVTARHNRGRQGIEMIERCFGDLRALGLASETACDFLLGLEGTTVEGMLEEIETVLRRFRPKWIDIFMLTPTHAYVTKHFGGSWEGFWKHIRRFEELVPPALPALAARTGYVVRMGHGHHMMLQRGAAMGRVTALVRFLARGLTVPFWPSKQPKFSYFYTALSSEARRPINLLGFGRSARSAIFGTAAFAAHDPEDNPAVAGPATYVGNRVDLADEVRTFLVHILRDKDTIDRVEFRQIFGNDMDALIPTALEAWERDGTVRLEDDALRFVPQDRQARVRSLLWLVPEEHIEFDLAHFNQLDLSPAGIARLVSAIKPGAALAGGHTFTGTDGARLVVRTPDGHPVRLRVAPELANGAPLRLVRENTPPTGDVHGVEQAAAELLGILTDRHRKLTSGPPLGMKQSGNRGRDVSTSSIALQGALKRA